MSEKGMEKLKELIASEKEEIRRLGIELDEHLSILEKLREVDEAATGEKWDPLDPHNYFRI